MQFRLAKSYQEYMKLIPIPVERGTTLYLMDVVRQLYRADIWAASAQPDLSSSKAVGQRVRIGSKDEIVPLDMIIHPCKAEAGIWIIEEIHRHTSSPHHLAKLWENDPSHHALIDAIFPKL